MAAISSENIVGEPIESEDRISDKYIKRILVYVAYTAIYHSLQTEAEKGFIYIRRGDHNACTAEAEISIIETNLCVG